MDGGIGVLILFFLGLAAALAVLLLVLNGRWKSTGQQLREARSNVVPATALLLLGVAGVGIAIFVVSQLLL